ncbi:hypothetical protein [Parvularcula lutaonensis]|uniref:Uncharacterized protein n=1 Tax=Parvularcula lutaonensis TaxID=491923 RepID=A0ABV7M7Y0_9PROT|nr:hypothetical protein [Parvularcula lutaonensis]GGY43388.1 hypothetical protein GCM10007148_10170 [Parvularcula lutaonensis]
MFSILAASSGNFFSIFAAPSLQAIILFFAAFFALNVLEKGRWD